MTPYRHPLLYTLFIDTTNEPNASRIRHHVIKSVDNNTFSVLCLTNTEPNSNYSTCFRSVRHHTKTLRRSDSNLRIPIVHRRYTRTPEGPVTRIEESLSTEQTEFTAVTRQLQDSEGSECAIHSRG